MHPSFGGRTEERGRFGVSVSRLQFAVGQEVEINLHAVPQYFDSSQRGFMALGLVGPVQSPGSLTNLKAAKTPSTPRRSAMSFDTIPGSDSSIS